MQYALAVGRRQFLVLPARGHRSLPVPIFAALLIARVVTSPIYVALSAHNTPPYQAVGARRSAFGPRSSRTPNAKRQTPNAKRLSPTACSQGAAQERAREL